MAIQASLTGHLVFSTLHTNDSAGAITRLVNMGIETFLVSSSTIAIMAQRLVRRWASSEAEREARREQGTLIASGLMAGAAIIGTIQKPAFNDIIQIETQRQLTFGINTQQ